jgi:hypothetical protein
VIFISFMWLLGLAVICWGCTLIINYFKSSQRELREQHQRDLDIRGQLRVRLYSAEKTLRTIANDSGNPAIEAQIYLDTNSKEIDV